MPLHGLRRVEGKIHLISGVRGEMQAAPVPPPEPCCRGGCSCKRASDNTPLPIGLLEPAGRCGQWLCQALRPGPARVGNAAL
eukprot:5586336-Lingulodinium_polyedra.AAC.1